MDKKLDPKIRPNKLIEKAKRNLKKKKKECEIRIFNKKDKVKKC